MFVNPGQKFKEEIKNFKRIGLTVLLSGLFMWIFLDFAEGVPMNEDVLSLLAFILSFIGIYLMRTVGYWTKGFVMKQMDVRAHMYLIETETEN